MVTVDVSVSLGCAARHRGPTETLDLLGEGKNNPDAQILRSCILAGLQSWFVLSVMPSKKKKTLNFIWEETNEETKT